MDARDEKQRALIYRTLGARTGGEAEAAERAADEWLEDNPGDGAGPRDGER